jgi:diguanylate cyclase (GGDEF)-like protein/PAS domain S-box-containing protein
VRTSEWRAILAAGIGISLLGALTGLAGLARVVVVVGFVAVIVRALRTNRSLAHGPWRVLLVSGVLALVHAIVRLVHGAIVDEVYPSPSPADLVGYAAYALMILGAVWMVRLRTLERRREASTDAAIVSVVVATLVVGLLLSEFLADDAVSGLLRLTVLGNALAISALAGVAARVAFGPGERNAAYYLISVAVFIIIANDVLLRGYIAGWDWALGVSQAVAPYGFVLVASAIMHPDVVRLTDRPRYEDRRLGRRRLLLLSAALLVGPTLLLMPELGIERPNRVLAMVSTVVIGLLVLLRMVDLVRAREDATSRERNLRGAATRLTTATDVSGVLEAALDGCVEASSEPALARASLYSLGESIELVESVGVGSSHAYRRLRPDALYHEHGDRPDVEVVTLENVPAVDADRESAVFTALVPIGNGDRAEYLAVLTQPSVITQEQVATLEGFASQVNAALESVALREQLHQRRANRRFQALVENSSDVVLVVDENHRVSFVSPTVERLLGRREPEVLGVEVAEMLHRPDQLHLRRLLAAPGRAGSANPSIEVRLRHGSGELRWFEIEASDLRSEEEVRGIVVTASDINDRKRAEAQLMRSEARFRLMVQNSSDVVAIVDENALISYVSPSIHRMLGFSPVEVLGRNVFELLSVTEAERLRSDSVSALSGSTIEVRVQGADGRVRAVEVAITDMRDQPEVDGIVLNVRDVTERKSLEDDLRHQALHDDLTGLANRVLFTERVSEAVRTAKRTRELVGVLFVDLDDFKLINDSLGHIVGDQVLVGVADRVQQCLRLSDMAARLGGDEFAVLLTGVYGESEITAVADRVREAISRPVVIGDHEFQLTASIGIAVAGAGEGVGEDLLRAADLAMYRAKQGGKDRHEIFEDYMEASVVEELELKTALKRAIERQEFVLHYQPIVDMASNRIRGVEALIRWEDPNRGLISPAAFIPLAEETGLIKDIGMWVAETAMTDLARWREQGHDLYCSFNVSGRQMTESDFGERLIAVVEASGVDPRAVVIELTESVLAVPGTSELFDEFHAKGFRIALDDFGTGYSALQYLQTFDIDLIKIDRSFVTALGDTRDSSVVKAVLDVAASIEAKTVAEGIEDAGELGLLKELGVDLGQGYYFSRPVPEQQLLGLLSSESSAASVV